MVFQRVLFSKFALKSLKMFVKQNLMIFLFWMNVPKQGPNFEFGEIKFIFQFLYAISVKHSKINLAAISELVNNIGF